MYRFMLLAVGCCASFCNVTAIAVDRYLAIVHPLKYPEYVTERVVLLIVAFNWCGAIAVATVPSYWNNYDQATSCELYIVVPRYVFNSYHTSNHADFVFNRTFFCFAGTT